MHRQEVSEATQQQPSPARTSTPVGSPRKEQEELSEVPVEDVFEGESVDTGAVPGTAKVGPRKERAKEKQKKEETMAEELNREIDELTKAEGGVQFEKEVDRERSARSKMLKLHVLVTLDNVTHYVLAKRRRRLK